MIKYSKNIGVKFHEDGSVRRFPGNSIISKINEQHSIYKHLIHIKNMFQDTKVASKYTFLPTDSYHMTVIDLVCDEIREKNKWSEKLPLDISLEETDNYFKDALLSVQELGTIRMKFDVLFISPTVFVVRLFPETEEQESKLKVFREQVALATGVRHSNHETYRFHVSFAYLIELLGEEDEKELKDLENKINQYLRTVDDVFELDAPELVLFKDMFSFPTERPQ